MGREPTVSAMTRTAAVAVELRKALTGPKRPPANSSISAALGELSASRFSNPSNFAMRSSICDLEADSSRSHHDCESGWPHAQLLAIARTFSTQPALSRMDQG